MEFKNLNEDTRYHHGSFKDLQTFLDKNGNPYTLIKSDPSKSNSKGKGQSSQQNNNQSDQDSSNSQDQSDQQNNQSNQSNDSQNQSQGQQSNQSQNNSKVPPDPNASYVDVVSGYEYKWDVQKNQFVKVGKYRAK